MIFNTIALSDGLPCEVKQLGLFELDSLEPPITEPFLYTVTVGENKLTRPYFWQEWEKPPEKPANSANAQEGSVEWWQWAEYQFYWAARFHDENTIPESRARFLLSVASYILEECLKPEDRERIVTPEDWRLVTYAALVPQLSLDDLQRALQRSFRATYQDRPILESLLALEGGNAAYDAVKVWEVQAMTSSGMIEDDWSNLSLEERARKVVAHKLENWLTALELDDHKRNKVRV